LHTSVGQKMMDISWMYSNSIGKFVNCKQDIIQVTLRHNYSNGKAPIVLHYGIVRGSKGSDLIQGCQKCWITKTSRFEYWTNDLIFSSFKPLGNLDLNFKSLLLDDTDDSIFNDFLKVQKLLTKFQIQEEFSIAYVGKKITKHSTRWFDSNFDISD